MISSGGMASQRWQPPVFECPLLSHPPTIIGGEGVLDARTGLHATQEQQDRFVELGFLVAQHRTAVCSRQLSRLPRVDHDAARMQRACLRRTAITAPR